ncbi:hypothetical protein NMY22_g11579 [Coprinellus aureogranulatus]|nr:hypothetical protein NMY22_g11579 [Coprinellus aureogranulatus]
MKSLLSTLLLLVTVLSTNALPLIPSSEIATKSAQGLRLLSLSESGSPVWKTENEVLDLVKQGKNFFDVTDTYDLEQKIAEKAASAKKVADDLPLVYVPPSHADEVKSILATMTRAGMEANLNVLTSFNNRSKRLARA